MPHTLKALSFDVIVHPLEDPILTSGGLYKPDSHKRKNDQGIIIDLGPHARAFDLSVGDHVLFSGYSGSKVSLEGTGHFYVLNVEHIIAKIVPSPIRLFDTQTLQTLLTELLGDLKAAHSSEAPAFEKFCEAALSRLESSDLSYSFEWY